MSDIDALAQGLHETGEYNECRYVERMDEHGDNVPGSEPGLVIVDRECSPEYHVHQERAQALAATPPVADLLRLAAIGRAVERLPQGWILTNWGYRWEVRQPQAVSVGRGSGPTPDAAIAAALEGETDD